jgi:hypothetical protein
MLIIDQCFKIKSWEINCSTNAAQKIYKDNEINGVAYFVDPDLIKKIKTIIKKN